MHTPTPGHFSAFLCLPCSGLQEADFYAPCHLDSLAAWLKVGCGQWETEWLEERKVRRFSPIPYPFPPILTLVLLGDNSSTALVTPFLHFVPAGPGVVTVPHRCLSLDAPPDSWLCLSLLSPLQTVLPFSFLLGPFRFPSLMSSMTFPSPGNMKAYDSSLGASLVFCSPPVFLLLSYTIPLASSLASLHAGSCVSCGSSITVRSLPTKPTFTLLFAFQNPSMVP